jgi:hypothetical protein
MRVGVAVLVGVGVGTSCGEILATNIVLTLCEADWKAPGVVGKSDECVYPAT